MRIRNGRSEKLNYGADKRSVKTRFNLVNNQIAPISESSYRLID